jgi:protein-disulfide isomerase
VPAQQIIREYVDTGRVNILYRHFPFIGDESWRAAEASECAAEQDRFHEYEETVYVNWNGENRGAYSDGNLRVFAEMTGLLLDQYDECMSSNKYLQKVVDDFEAGIAAGVKSTPTIFLNGEIIGGLRDYGDYRVKIEKALAEVGG